MCLSIHDLYYKLEPEEKSKVPIYSPRHQPDFSIQPQDLELYLTILINLNAERKIFTFN